MPEQISAIARFVITGATLAFSFYLANFASPKRATFGIMLFALPLLCQVVRYPLVRAYGLWRAFFLVLQGLLVMRTAGGNQKLCHPDPELVDKCGVPARQPDRHHRRAAHIDRRTWVPGVSPSRLCTRVWPRLRQTYLAPATSSRDSERTMPR
jgi:hypothetical protein